MNKHTPGPWTRETVRTSVGVCFKVGPFPWSRGRLNHACIYADYPSPSSPEYIECAANATLIAAAPELLNACLAMIEWDAREQDHAVDFQTRMALCKSAFDKARAAIVKATGEAA